MTDALIGELSKVDELTVISQASTKLISGSISLGGMLFTNEINDIDYFVNGYLKHQMNTVDIRIQLKESLQSEPIWEKHYSDDISKGLQLWATIAEDLTRQMGIIVKPEDKELWSNLRPLNQKPMSYI